MSEVQETKTICCVICKERKKGRYIEGLWICYDCYQGTIIRFCPTCRQQKTFSHFKCDSCGTLYDKDLQKKYNEDEAKKCNIIFDKRKLICERCRKLTLCNNIKNDWDGERMQ